jgi:hypothetical protein
MTADAETADEDALYPVFEQMWSEMVQHIHAGDGDKAHHVFKEALMLAKFGELEIAR